MPYVGSVNLSGCDAVTLGKAHGRGVRWPRSRPSAVRRIAGAAPVPLRIALEPLKRLAGGGLVQGGLWRSQK